MQAPPAATGTSHDSERGKKNSLQTVSLICITQSKTEGCTVQEARSRASQRVDSSEQKKEVIVVVTTSIYVKIVNDDVKLFYSACNGNQTDTNLKAIL